MRSSSARNRSTEVATRRDDPGVRCPVRVARPPAWRMTVDQRERLTIEALQLADARDAR